MRFQPIASALDRAPKRSHWVDWNVTTMAEQLPAGCEFLRQTVRGDHRGSLIAIEGSQDVPFDIARVYYLYDTVMGESRGFHAHRHLRQFAVCLAGACDVVLDDGCTRVTVRLDDPTTGLLITSSVWREMHNFAPGTVLMVLANHVYDESDYIRSYDQFCAGVIRGVGE